MSRRNVGTATAGYQNFVRNTRLDYPYAMPPVFATVLLAALASVSTRGGTDVLR